MRLFFIFLLLFSFILVSGCLGTGNAQAGVMQEKPNMNKTIGSVADVGVDGAKSNNSSVVNGNAGKTDVGGVASTINDSADAGEVAGGGSVEYGNESKNAENKDIGIDYPYANISTQTPKGAKNPILIIDEYISFSCVASQRAENITNKMLELYPDEIAIRIRHFPLPQTPKAYEAAQAFECAADQQKEWEMERLLYENKGKFTLEGLSMLAKIAGVGDMEMFGKCMQTGAKKAVVDADLEIVKKMGMKGTPYFILGNRTIYGLHSEEYMLSELYRALKEAKEKA